MKTGLSKVEIKRYFRKRKELEHHSHTNEKQRNIKAQSQHRQRSQIFSVFNGLIQETHGGIRKWDGFCWNEREVV